MDKRQLVFEGLDDFNRPVFKQVGTNLRFGSTNKTFSGSDSNQHIQEMLSEEDIVYFGTKFGCEPDGTPIKPDRIELIFKR